MYIIIVLYYIYTLLLLIYTPISIINKSIYREIYIVEYISVVMLVQMGCTPPCFAVTLVTRHAKKEVEGPCIMWCNGWFVLQDCRLKQDCTYSDNLQNSKRHKRMLHLWRICSIPMNLSNN